MKYLNTLFVSSVIVLAASSQAVILNDDVWTPLGGDTRLAGTVVADDLVDFSLANGVSGQIQNRVVRAADNTLMFAWQVRRSAGGTGLNVTALRLSSFDANVYDADWKSDGGGTQPATFARKFGGGGGFVNFRFSETLGDGSGVEAGEWSRLFYLKTDATEFARTATYNIVSSDDTFTGQFSTYEPIPEPATMTMLGLGALALIRKRRARASK